MFSGEMNVLEVAAAFEKPLESLDLWLQWAPDESAQRLREVVDAIGADDTVNSATARLVLGWSGLHLSVTGIARQAGINSSAVSQRKSRIERILAELFDDPAMKRHPIVEIWNDRASRCVRVSDLPIWMSGFLVTGDIGRAWGVPEDIFWVSLHAVMHRPRLIEHGGEQWLIDLELDTRSDTKGQFRSFLDSVADSFTQSDSVVLSTKDFEELLLRTGISRLSLESLTEDMRSVARRTLSLGDQIMILNDKDSRNLGLIAKQAMDILQVDRANVPDLIADQHGRSSKSVSNELRKL